jgi:hypothetical protein
MQSTEASGNKILAAIILITTTIIILIIKEVKLRHFNANNHVLLAGYTI